MMKTTRRKKMMFHEKIDIPSKDNKTYSEDIFHQGGLTQLALKNTLQVLGLECRARWAISKEDLERMDMVLLFILP
jgi:hypothetical protein